MWMHGVKIEPSFCGTGCWTAALLDFNKAFDKVHTDNLHIAQAQGPSGSPINQQQMKACHNMRTRLLLKSIRVSLDYMYVNMCPMWSSEHTLLTNAIYLGEKQFHPSWLTIIVRFSLVTALKINGLLCSRKDLSTM